MGSDSFVCEKTPKDSIQAKGARRPRKNEATFKERNLPQGPLSSLLPPWQVRSQRNGLQSRSLFRNSSAPAVWSQSEKKYIDKKEATCFLDEKRGVSLLSIHRKKYHHAIMARSDLILGATSSRTQSASKGVGCMPQILGLSQIIANRWREGRKVICVAIDLKKYC